MEINCVFYDMEKNEEKVSNEEENSLVERREEGTIISLIIIVNFIFITNILSQYLVRLFRRNYFYTLVIFSLFLFTHLIAIFNYSLHIRTSSFVCFEI